MNKTNRGKAFVMSGRPRHYHYAFVSIQTLFSLLFIGGAGWFINYLSTFQSGILGFGHIATGIMIGLFIKPVALMRYIEEILKNPPATREELENKIAFYMYRDGCAVVIVCALSAILFSCFFGYNLIMITGAYCPAHHSVHHFQDNEPPRAGSISVLLYYDHTPRGEYYPRSHILQLQYNATTKQVLRRTKESHPDRYKEWYTSHQTVHPYNKQQDIEESDEVVAAATDATTKNLFCINRADSLFSFLDNEITHELELNQKAREESKTMRFNIRDYISRENNNAVRITDDDENANFIDMMTRFICRNEFAFIIIMMTMIGLWDCLMVALIGYNIFLWRLHVD